MWISLKSLYQNKAVGKKLIGLGLIYPSTTDHLKNYNNKLISYRKYIDKKKQINEFPILTAPK